MLAAAHPTPAPSPLRATPARPARPMRLRLWLPLTPLFLLLGPVALLFAPIVWLGLPRRPRNPFPAAVAIGRVLLSLGGTIVDIEAPGVRLFIRIF